MNIVLFAIGSLIFGCVVGYINSLISKKAMTGADTAGAMGVNVFRFILDVACLAIVYIVCRMSGTAPLIPLIAAAAGLTICGMFFLIRVTNEISRKMEKDASSTQNDNTGE